MSSTWEALFSLMLAADVTPPLRSSLSVDASEEETSKSRTTPLAIEPVPAMSSTPPFEAMIVPAPLIAPLATNVPAPLMNESAPRLIGPVTVRAAGWVMDNVVVWLDL